MNSFSTDNPAYLPSAHTIFRPMGGVETLREVRDPAGRLMVSAFPCSLAKGLAPIFDGVAACYLLADHMSVYVGESLKMGQRLIQHANDMTKMFAREVYVIHGQHPFALDRSALLYLQHRLIDSCEDAGLVAVANSAAAHILPWSNQDRAVFEHFVKDSQRLLFDAGCRAINSNFASQLPPNLAAEIGASAEDEEELEINVPQVPPPGGELDLNYCGLFARGYWSFPKGFVVMAGAEVRKPVNESTRKNIAKLRVKLEAAQALVPIAGVNDRWRLQFATRFFSAAVAAKVLTGAHVAATKWVRPSYPQPMPIAD